MNKFKKISLKLCKYFLLCFIFFFILSCIIFINYSRKQNYQLPIKQTVEVYDNNNNLFFTMTNGNKQTYVPLKLIDKNLVNAFISIEDKRFYKHHGIDPIRIGGAIIADIKSTSLKEGASTITQQYVRNLFLTQNKEISRKVQEIAIAINIETKYSKNEILEGYLNTIYFGHGIYGVSDAANFFFNKSCSNLTLSECAILAAIPKGPLYYSPIYDYPKNLERKELILNEMLKDNVISSNDYLKAINEYPLIIGNINRDYNDNYYKDLIVNIINSDKYNLSFYDHLKVYTSFDASLFNISSDAIKKYYPENDDIEIALFAIDVNTKEVLLSIGGINYSSSSFNRSTNSLRQPGSTIKPFLYYDALENGFTPITTIYSGKTNFIINGESYSPSNFNNIYPNKEITMAYALATSDNMYALKTHLFLGIDVLKKRLESLNFSSEIKENASLCLGTSEVYLSELVNAYSTIASLGYIGKNKYITKITDESDNILYENTEKNHLLLNPSTCYILSETMTNVFDNNLAININVTGYPISSMLHHKYAGKSGSTDYDNWMIGYNNTIALGIWCGYDDNRIQNNASTKFIKYIWADIIEGYSKISSNYGWYETPRNVVSISLNPTYGRISKGSEYQKNMYFNIDNFPWYIYNN